MEYRIITVVFTKRPLSPLEMSDLKRYRFICEQSVKIGDMIDSPKYATPCQVVDINYSDRIPTSPSGYSLKKITIDSINGKLTNQIHKKMKETHSEDSNNMFDQLITSFTAQYMPTKEPEVRMSMTGILCVPQGDKYVGIDANNKLISFLPAMTISGLPVFSIERPASQVVPGDIIKRNRSYAKVLKNTPEGLKVLSFSGTASNQAAITDMLLGQATFRVLVNFFSPNGGMGNINPMMLLLMGKQGDGDEGLIQAMVMSQMFQGGAPNMFGGMFQQPVAQQSAGQPAEQPAQPVQPMFSMFQQSPVQQPAQQPVAPPDTKVPTVDEILAALTQDPEALKKVKEALNK